MKKDTFKVGDIAIVTERSDYLGKRGEVVEIISSSIHKPIAVLKFPNGAERFYIKHLIIAPDIVVIDGLEYC